MTADSYLQFIAILIIFVVVLGLTYYVTKWLAGYQKEKNIGKNIEVLETGRISTTKYIQIVRLGNKYMWSYIPEESSLLKRVWKIFAVLSIPETCGMRC